MGQRPQAPSTRLARTRRPPSSLAQFVTAALYFKQHRDEYYRLLDRVGRIGDSEARFDYFLDGAGPGRRARRRDDAPGTSVIARAAGDHAQRGVAADGSVVPYLSEGNGLPHGHRPRA